MHDELQCCLSRQFRLLLHVNMKKLTTRIYRVKQNSQLVSFKMLHFQICNPRLFQLYCRLCETLDL
jgi:hypothetical protein